MKDVRVLAALAGVVFATSAQAQPASSASSQTNLAPQAKPAAHAFPADSKLAYVDLNRLSAESADGKAARAKLTQFQDTKKAELQKKQEALRAAQQKLSQTGSVLNEAARSQLQKEADRLDRELQRATQDAQDDLNALNRDLLNEFQKKVIPIVTKVAEEKGLHAVFSLGDAAFVWYDPTVDITADVLKRLESPQATPNKP